MNFEAFVKDIRDNHWNVHGVEVYENGVLTHSCGDTEENLHNVYSIAKSILSITIGIAWDRGQFDPDLSVLSYMPKERTEKLSERQRETFETITIRRLMCMSVGDLPFPVKGESWLDHALACPVANPRAMTFNYSNNSAYLAGVALTEALGTDLGEFIEDNIFAPLGITRFSYTRCPDGYFYGASNVMLTVHDLSRIGLLLLNGGVYDGRRIVSEEYVRMATSCQLSCDESGYGYFFWMYPGGFSMNGTRKQKCYVLPSRNMMVTYLSDIEDPSSALKDSMEKYVLGQPNPETPENT
jgi:CubicO group peptidase (beta-lactamase class C family)